MASFHLQEQIAKHLEKYPAIWNSKGGEKSNRDKVAYQWKQLAADVGSDEGAIKKSYNTLRSRFRSEFNKRVTPAASGSGAVVHINTYPLYEELSFLIPSLQRRETVSSTIPTREEAIDMNETDSTMSFTEPVATSTQVPVAHSTLVPVPTSTQVPVTISTKERVTPRQSLFSPPPTPSSVATKKNKVLTPSATNTPSNKRTKVQRQPDSDKENVRAEALSILRQEKDRIHHWGMSLCEDIRKLQRKKVQRKLMLEFTTRVNQCIDDEEDDNESIFAPLFQQ